jgi:bacteriocin-like protein
MKKLELKRKVVSVMTDKQMQTVEGGGTTSYSNCTGFTCCSPQGGCGDISVGNSCTIDCVTTMPPASSLGQKKCLCT